MVTISGFPDGLKCEVRGRSKMNAEKEVPQCEIWYKGICVLFDINGNILSGEGKLDHDKELYAAYWITSHRPEISEEWSRKTTCW